MSKEPRSRADRDPEEQPEDPACGSGGSPCAPDADVQSAQTPAAGGPGAGVAAGLTLAALGGLAVLGGGGGDREAAGAGHAAPAGPWPAAPGAPPPAPAPAKPPVPSHVVHARPLPAPELPSTATVEPAIPRQPSKIAGASIGKAADDPPPAPVPAPDVPPPQTPPDRMASPPVQPADPIKPRTVTASIHPGPAVSLDDETDASLSGSPSSLTLRLKHDSGESSSDRLTRDATVVVEGLDPLVHSQWWYSVDGGPWQDGVGDTIPDTAFRAEGQRHVDVEAADAMGQVTDRGSLSVELDRTPPDPQRHWVRLEGASGQFVNELGSPDPLGAYQLVRDATVMIGPLPQDVRWNYAIRPGAADDSAARQEGQGGEIPHAAFQPGANELSIAFRDLAGNATDTMHLHHLYLNPPVV